MPVIYEPKGRAREYSPQALNLYLSCPHGCIYCYAPSALQRTRENYFQRPEPRKNIIENLKNEVGRAKKKQILLSFAGDVYCDAVDKNAVTREALYLLLDARLPVAILTKGGLRCVRDMNIFENFNEHIQIGATLTFDNDIDSRKWEPGAALPSERIKMLEILKTNNIRTFASFEPVIHPEQSLSLMEKCVPYVDIYKIGKINNFQGLDKKINWESFLKNAVDLLRSHKKPFYIKHDLRVAAPGVKLYGNEVLPDEHNVS